MTRALAPAGVLALGLYLTAPVLGCLEACFVDLGALHGEKTGAFEIADTRLHAWILAWVQHSVLSEPASLYDTNAFYPAVNTLTGSEHTLGIALPMLPFRLLTADAVAIHQLALVLSFLLLGATAFALVRWLTGEDWPAFVSAALAMLMPWRIGELSHIQLLHAQWFPLVWLLAARILMGGRSRLDAPLLAAVLALQLLSSFYLAYFLLFSVAVLLAVLVYLERPRRTALLRLAAAVAPALLLLALSSLPYLARESAAGLTPEATPIHSIGPATAWQTIAPPLGLGFGSAPAGAYAVPLVVWLLAAATLPFAMRRASDARERRARDFGLAMWAVALGAFVMMIGREWVVAGVAIPLPSRIAAWIVPGFSMLRAPFRWGLLIGLAAPVLCGLAIFHLERRFAPRTRAARRSALRAALAALLVANAGTRPLPVRAAWEPDDPIRAAHAALRALSPGPVVEVPWPTATLAAQNRESRTLLASSLHWNPILNGYTGYPPATYFLLRRVAQRLPERGALDRLRALADLRYAVVHTDLLSAERRSAWAAAAASGDLALRRSVGAARIYEVTRPGSGGDWTAALLSKQPRAKTFAGLARDPLDPSQNAGQLAAELPASLERMLWPREQHPIQLTIANRSARDWPGFDSQSEGLVELRYAFRAGDGTLALEATTPLDTDLPANATTAATAYIASPRDAGTYRLRVDLVQRVGGELRALPVRGAERDVVVRAAPSAAPASRNANPDD
ncbi:MAG: hypothetical protein JSU66_00500 [Deltaproteobacteria bacterium]|nr:MAG: hypothetical protein JSU66_00500 [Deltaproteobacteria bacterium]